jgi:superfamily II DNA or RNA helicase
MPTRRARSASGDEGVGGARRSSRRGKSSGSNNKNEETNDDSSVAEDMSVNEVEDEAEEDSDVSDVKARGKRRTSRPRKGNKKDGDEGQQLSLKNFAVKGTKTSTKSSSDAIQKKAATARRSARPRASDNDDESDAKEDEDEDEQKNHRPRRSTRTGRKTVNLNEKALAKNDGEDDDESEQGQNNDEDADIDANDADDDNLDHDMLSENGDEKKDNVVRRKSSRSTKFASSMAEPAQNSGFEMEILPSSPSPAKSKKRPTTKKQATKKKQQVPKSPAIRHTSKRKHKSPVKQDDEVYEDADLSEEEEEGNYSDDGDDESQEEMKIQKIIASRSETRKKWADICKTFNTSEVDNGSRWFQEPAKHIGKSADTYEERYLVKWSGLGYLHCSWETKDDLLELVDTASTHLRNFFAKSQGGYFFSADERGDGDYFDPGYVGIERILEIANDGEDHPEDAGHLYGMIFKRDDPDYESGTGRQFLIKWASLPYSDATYEFERDLIINNVEYEPYVKALEKRMKKPTKKDVDQADKVSDGARRKLFMTFGESNKIAKTTKAAETREAQASKFQKDLENQKFQNGGQLRDYQAEGVSWLLSNYINKRSCILADEMGLGKTIQTACYVNYVARILKRRGPFLIVAPLSTIPHWTREFRGWTDLNTVVYYGSQEDRTNIRQNEFPFFEDRREIYNNKSHYLKRCHKKKARKHEQSWMIEVVITTPETLVLEDYKELCAVDWDILVVDEAHRLKNHESKLAINMTNADFSFNNILLLTGTPIQNNLNELWALLHFADREKFPKLEDFAAEYGEMKSKEKIDQLHEVIRPYILRRLKEDVEKSVPPKEETLIEVELTSTQKQYYRALYEKNVQFLHRNRTKLDMPSVSNLAMQLRKCCNSAFLIKGVEDEIRRKEKQEKSNISEADLLVKSSGKLVLLDKLLPRLKRDGHKLLIFSQFKIMLDIIEDYLNARQLKHERIDGSITGNKRQNAIDRFQATDEEGKESPFVMLLTTKAGKCFWWIWQTALAILISTFIL